jgi:small subunit ribosomal protein S17
MTTELAKKTKRKLTGVVVSDKSTKTVVVKVELKKMHSKYHKFVTNSNKFHAHDEKGEAKIGDTVTIIESRPRSALKRWELLSVVK